MSRRKTLTAAVAIGLIISVLCSFISFEAGCDNIRNSVLRLHVLANSDSEEDQALKLKVRDSILEKSSYLFEKAESLKESEQIARDNLDFLAETARQTVEECGYDYPVSVMLTPAEFNTRVYDSATLPAGEYDALRVVIGEGAGKNWWCVLFPAMCVGAAQDSGMSEVVEGESLKIAEEPEKYTVKFKAVEIYEWIKGVFKGEK